jgi:hypothetical protein
VKKIKCQHCRTSILPDNLLNGQYCQECVHLRVNHILEGSDVHLRGALKCSIPGCANHTDEGRFVGEICAPCHSYIARNEGTCSQAYRNEVFKANLRSLAKWLSDNPGGSLFIVEDGAGRKIEMMRWRVLEPTNCRKFWREEAGKSNTVLAMAYGNVGCVPKAARSKARGGRRRGQV